MSTTDSPTTNCPTDVVDRLLWRNAQRILHRHVTRLDGTCHWCEGRGPCGLRELAERAEALSRAPLRDARHEVWADRNVITRLMPMINPETCRNQRFF